MIMSESMIIIYASNLVIIVQLMVMDVKLWNHVYNIMKNWHVNLHTLLIQLIDVYGQIKDVDRENAKIWKELLINLVNNLFQDVLQMVKIVLDQIIYVKIYLKKLV